MSTTLNADLKGVVMNACGSEHLSWESGSEHLRWESNFERLIDGTSLNAYEGKGGGKQKYDNLNTGDIPQCDNL